MKNKKLQIGIISVLVLASVAFYIYRSYFSYKTTESGLKYRFIEGEQANQPRGEGWYCLMNSMENRTCMKLWRWGWWKKILGIVGPPRCSDAFAVVARVLEVCLVITRLGGVRDTKHVREHSNASSALEGRYKCW